MFCPEQAILDDAHIELVKHTLQDPQIGRGRSATRSLALIREVMASPDKTFMYHLPLPSRDPVYARYPLEDDDRRRSGRRPPAIPGDPADAAQRIAGRAARRDRDSTFPASCRTTLRCTRGGR